MQAIAKKERLRKERVVTTSRRYKRLNIANIPIRGEASSFFTSHVLESQVLVDNNQHANSDASDEDETKRQGQNNDGLGWLYSDASSEEEDVFYMSCDPPSMGPTEIYFNPKWGIPWFEVRMRLTNANQFRDAIRRYFIVKRCKLKLIKNEPIRQRYHCIGVSYEWEIFASMDNKNKCIWVKTYTREHTCVRTSQIPMMIEDQLAKYWKED